MIAAVAPSVGQAILSPARPCRERHSRKTLRGKADLYGIAQTSEFPNELLLAASTGLFVAGQGSEFLVIHLIVKDLPNDFEKVMGHGYNRFLDS